MSVTVERMGASEHVFVRVDGKVVMQFDGEEEAERHAEIYRLGLLAKLDAPTGDTIPDGAREDALLEALKQVTVDLAYRDESNCDEEDYARIESHLSEAREVIRQIEETR
jgi:hypothetical protein